MTLWTLVLDEQTHVRAGRSECQLGSRPAGWSGRSKAHLRLAVRRCNCISASRCVSHFALPSNCSLASHRVCVRVRGGVVVVSVCVNVRPACFADANVATGHIDQYCIVVAKTLSPLQFRYRKVSVLSVTAVLTDASGAAVVNQTHQLPFRSGFFIAPFNATSAVRSGIMLCSCCCSSNDRLFITATACWHTFADELHHNAVLGWGIFPDHLVRPVFRNR